MMDTRVSGRVRLSPSYRIQWLDSQQTYVLLYPEGMVRLNPSASQILKHCDGSLTEAEIRHALSSQCPDADFHDELGRFLEVAWERGWITYG